MIKKDIKAFSMIEILVWILIFTMWVVSVYSIIISTLNLNDHNKNYIIASFLAREQIELVRNIRDSNYKKIQIYNQINPNSNDHTQIFETWTYYKIENDLNSTTWFPVKVSKILDFWEWVSELNGKMLNYNLCLNSDNVYTFECSSPNIKTFFYRYIKIDKIQYNDTTWTKTIDEWFKVTSKVIWYMKWYHEFEIINIFTDYKRF